MANMDNQPSKPTETVFPDGEDELFLEALSDSSDENTKKKLDERIKEYTEENKFCKPGRKLLGLAIVLLVAILLAILYLSRVNSEKGFAQYSQGSTEWPDAACPVDKPFGNCDSNSAADGDEWATAVCQKNGFMRGKWTGTKESGCSGNVAMSCQHEFLYSSTCREAYRNGCSPGKQSRILVKCVGQQEAKFTIKETAPELTTIGLDKSLKQIISLQRDKLQPQTRDTLQTAKSQLLARDTFHQFSNVRSSANKFPEPSLSYYKHVTLDDCSGTLKLKWTLPSGDSFCVTGSPPETTIEYKAHSGEDLEWCMYVEVDKSEQQSYRLEVSWKNFQTRKGRSRVYVQKDSQTPIFSSGSTPPERKDSSLRINPRKGQQSMCVRWVAVNTDATDQIEFTIGLYKDIGMWENAQCRGGGGRYYDRWWDGSCGVVYQKVTEKCPTSPGPTERCGEYQYDQLCRLGKCGTRSLADNTPGQSAPQFLNGYGMIDPDDPDLYKIEYSTRKSFNIRDIIKTLKERKASLETRWEKYGGEKVFNTSININPYQAEAATRLGIKLARALLLGDKFTIGFTGSSNTAGHHNMFYNTYPMQLQAFMRPIFSQHGFMGAAFQSKNNAWGGGLGTWTEAWCVKAMAGDDADIVTWESYMNDGGSPDPHICEIHLRNALFLKKRPLYHIIHAGKECDSTKWYQTEFRDPWKKFNDHYHAAGAGMMEFWPCHGAWQLAQEKGENHNHPRWLYVTWHPGPLGHREYAEIQAWNYLNATLMVLEPLVEKIQEAAPDGVPTSKLDETLKEPDVEPVPEPLSCGETCKGLGAAKASTTCFTALEPATQEATITYVLKDGNQYKHENGAAWGDNAKTLSAKNGGMNANDRKFKWSGGPEAQHGRFRLEIDVAYKYVMILSPYGYRDEKRNPPLPSVRWKITANGESMRCLTSSDWAKDDDFPLTIPQLLGHKDDAVTSWPGCIFECGAGLKMIEIWHTEDNKRIWIDNVIGI